MNKHNKPSASKTRQQIADELGMTYSSLWRKLKKHSIELPPGYVNLKFQKTIFDALGYPPGISRKDYTDD